MKTIKKLTILIMMNYCTIAAPNFFAEGSLGFGNAIHYSFMHNKSNANQFSLAIGAEVSRFKFTGEYQNNQMVYPGASSNPRKANFFINANIRIITSPNIYLGLGMGTFINSPIEGKAVQLMIGFSTPISEKLELIGNYKFFPNYQTFDVQLHMFSFGLKYNIS